MPSSLRVSTWSAFSRFAISGGVAACVAIVVYFSCAVVLALPPLVANLLSYGAQLGVGYQLHRSFSFRYVGVDGRSMTRYLTLSLAAFALNSFWVWLCVHVMHLPPWTPLAPMIFATPVMTFLLARSWVFAVHDGGN